MTGGEENDLSEKKKESGTALANVFACSFTGKSHIRSGKPCQDAYSVGKCSDGRIVLAVADGVSNSPHSEIASRVATKAAVEFWQTFDTAFPGYDTWQSALPACMNYALRKVEEAGKEVNCEPETTLAVALVSPEKELDYACIGDGAIYVLTDTGSVRSLKPPMRDEDGSVYTLSAGPELWNTGVAPLKEIQAILLVTDGISDVIRTTKSGYSAAIPFMQEPGSDALYDQFCENALKEQPFQNMEDDATFVLCRLKQAANGERKDERVNHENASEDPLPWHDHVDQKKDNSGSDFISMTRGVLRSIRGLFSDPMEAILKKANQRDRINRQKKDKRKEETDHGTD